METSSRNADISLWDIWGKTKNVIFNSFTMADDIAYSGTQLSETLVTTSEQFNARVKIEQHQTTQELRKELESLLKE